MSASPEEAPAAVSPLAAQALGERLRLLTDSTSDVVYLVRSDGILEWVSPSVTPLLGWQQADLVGTRPWFVVHPEDRERAAASFGDCLRTGQPPPEFELRILARDGSHRWMNASGHTIRIGQDVDGFVVGLRDIDDQVRTRGDEHAEHDRLQATRQALLDPHLLLHALRDDGGRVVDLICEDANPAACTALGRLQSDIEGSRLSAILPTSLRAVLLPRLVESAESGRPLVLNAAPYRREADAEERRYDVRTVQVAESISLTWRDVTGLHRTARELDRSERRFRQAMAFAGIGMCLAALDGTFLEVNAALCAFLGRDEADLRSCTWQELTHPDDLDADLELVRRVVDGERDGYRLAKRFIRADGTVAYGDLTVTAVRDEDGQVDYFIGQIVDVGHEVAARLALSRSERALRLAMASAPIGMAFVDLDRRFLQVNPALCQMLQRDAAWLLGHGIADVIHPDDDRADLAMRAGVLAGTPGPSRQEKRLLRADGTVVWVDHAIDLLRDEDDDPVSFVSQFIDSTQARQEREELRFLATHDPLTRLARRGVLLAHVAAGLGDPTAPDGPLAVLVLDIDGLGEVNHAFGHAVGDQALRQLADRLAGLVGGDGIVARLGGDEFGIAVRAGADGTEADRLAEQVRRAALAPVITDGRPVHLTVGIGMAVAEPRETADDLLWRAERALSAAKDAGRSRTVAPAPLAGERS